MKTNTLATLLTLFVIIHVATAFPAAIMNALQSGKFSTGLHKKVVRRQTTDPFLNLPTLSIPGILAPISVLYPGSPTTGRKAIPDAAHPFQAPPAGAQRGNCPGLDLLANYGYIDRSGITTVGQLLWAMQEALGMAPDLAGVLVALTFKGMTDLTTMKMSIGRTDSRTSGLFTYLLGGGPVPGLSSAAAQNKYEHDGSIVMDDSFFASGGHTDQFNSTLWAERKATAAAVSNGLYDINWVGAIRKASYDYCVANNPQCSWTAVNQVLFNGAEAFTYLTMPGTDTDGNSQLPPTSTAVETFMGIQQQGSSNTYIKVPSKLPPGPDGKWYRRAVGLTVAEIADVAVTVYLQHPVAFGANSGSTNSFIVQGQQLDPSNVNAQSVACLIVQQASENIPVSLLSITSQVTNLVNALLAPARLSLGC